MANINKNQKAFILDAWAYCDEEDKSTEFMLSYMSDLSGVDYDDVVAYITSEQAKLDRAEYYKNLK